MRKVALLFFGLVLVLVLFVPVRSLFFPFAPSLCKAALWHHVDVLQETHKRAAKLGGDIAVAPVSGLCALQQQVVSLERDHIFPDTLRAIACDNVSPAVAAGVGIAAMLRQDQSKCP